MGRVQVAVLVLLLCGSIAARSKQAPACPETEEAEQGFSDDDSADDYGGIGWVLVGVPIYGLIQGGKWVRKRMWPRSADDTEF